MLLNIIISAPSGGGKTTIVDELVKHGYEKSISYTTRKPREGEINGVHYWFVSVDEFKYFEQNDGFIETNEVYTDIYYGTPKRSNGAKPTIYIMDAEGAVNVIENKIIDNFTTIFINVDIETLEDRLKSRGIDDTYEKRVSKMRYELSLKDKFDAVIDNNGDISTSINKILEYLKTFS